MNKTSTKSILLLASFAPLAVLAGTTLLTNPPSECSAPNSTCGCSNGGDNTEKDDGTGNQGAEQFGNDGAGTENEEHQYA